MTTEADETLLTAFALDELDGAERARVAALVAGNAAAREFVEGVRETAGVVAAGLREESALTLLPIQREAIEQRSRGLDGVAKTQPAGGLGRESRVRRWLPLAASIAASVAIVGGIVAVVLPRLTAPPTAVEIDEHDGTALVVVGSSGGPTQPPLPGESPVTPDELASRDPAPPSVEDHLTSERDPVWIPVEPPKPAEPETPVAVKDERGSPLAERPTAPPEPRTPRGPAHSPDAEDVRATGPRPTLPPAEPGKRDAGTRSANVSLPDPGALERAIKSAADAPRVYENPFRAAAQRARSSFPVRVENSSYTLVQSNLLERKLPPAHRVRVEELINRFTYHDAPPAPGGPAVAASVEVAICPWDTTHRLARVAIKARDATDGVSSAVIAARDVEVSVEFNPLATASWRLIGYENAPPPASQPSQPPAIDLPAGGAAVALYEIVPTSLNPRTTTPDKELFTVAVRFRDPLDGAEQKLQIIAPPDARQVFDRASDDFRFTAAVAAFGMLLRDSQFKGDATFGDVIRWANNARGADDSRQRAEFVELARKANDLRK